MAKLIDLMNREFDIVSETGRQELGSFVEAQITDIDSREGEQLKFYGYYFHVGSKPVEDFSSPNRPAGEISYEKKSDESDGIRVQWLVDGLKVIQDHCNHVCELADIHERRDYDGLFHYAGRSLKEKPVLLERGIMENVFEAVKQGKVYVSVGVAADPPGKGCNR
ncbi:MAG: hypothetical protein KJ709_07505 [Nanoarchaeota archaeon]|nr:hypothetical protein [Nanoarchaeota archaeon]